jgi:hypothetical protein
MVVYGAGSTNPLKVWHRFYVTRGMDSLYNVLLGNLDTNRLGGRLVLPTTPTPCALTILPRLGDLPH